MEITCKKINKGDIVVMYHDIVNDKCKKSGFSNEGALQYTIRNDTFEEQIYSSIGKDIFFSFDDGGVSFYSVIPTILEKYGQKGIFFISTKFINTPRFLSDEQILALDKQGHIIASHSHSHPAMISSLSREECLNEWITSKKILENLVGHEVNAASIPGGAVSRMVIETMVDAGYKYLFTSVPSTNIREYRGCKIIGRYGITTSMNLASFNQLVNNQKYRRRLLIRYHTLRFAKLILGRHYNNLKQYILRLNR